MKTKRQVKVLYEFETGILKVWYGLRLILGIYKKD